MEAFLHATQTKCNNASLSRTRTRKQDLGKSFAFFFHGFNITGQSCVLCSISQSTHDHEHNYSLLEIKCYEVCFAQLYLTGHGIYSTVWKFSWKHSKSLYLSRLLPVLPLNTLQVP